MSLKRILARVGIVLALVMGTAATGVAIAAPASAATSAGKIADITVSDVPGNPAQARVDVTVGYLANTTLTAKIWRASTPAGWVKDLGTVGTVPQSGVVTFYVDKADFPNDRANANLLVVETVYFTSIRDGLAQHLYLSTPPVVTPLATT